MVYYQTRRWRAAGGLEAIVLDLHAIFRFAEGRAPGPTAASFDGRAMQPTPERGRRAGYDGAKRKQGSKVHAAVDTLGPLLALHVTPADVQTRDRVAALAEVVQDATGEIRPIWRTSIKHGPGRMRGSPRPTGDRPRGGDAA
jgi:hypothetical protein